jgi:hypothetical protein
MITRHGNDTIQKKKRKEETMKYTHIEEEKRRRVQYRIKSGIAFDHGNVKS